MAVPDVDEFNDFVKPKLEEFRASRGYNNQKAAKVIRDFGSALLRRQGKDGFDFSVTRLHNLLRGRVKGLRDDEWRVFMELFPSVWPQFCKSVNRDLHSTGPRLSEPGRDNDLESQLGKKYSSQGYHVDFRVPCLEGEFPVQRLCAHHVLELLKKELEEFSGFVPLSLSGGRSQFLVVEEIAKLCSQSNSTRNHRLQIVATNDFREPVGENRYSATTLVSRLSEILGGSALHAPKESQHDYNRALERTKVALMGAGANEGSFVAKLCKASFDGDVAGLGLTNDGGKPRQVRIPGLDDHLQRLTLELLGMWAHCPETTVLAVITGEHKATISDLALRMKLVNWPFLSRDLAIKLKDLP